MSFCGQVLWNFQTIASCARTTVGAATAATETAAAPLMKLRRVFAASAILQSGSDWVDVILRALPGRLDLIGCGYLAAIPDTAATRARPDESLASRVHSRDLSYMTLDRAARVLACNKAAQGR